MSKLYYDHLVDLSDVERELKKLIKDKDARDEIMNLIDETVHHKVLGCILDKLPEEHHKEFVSHVSSRPDDENIFIYLREKIGHDIAGFVKEEMYQLGKELLEMIHSEKKFTSKSK